MTSPDLARLVTGFFVRHLAAERNVSPHTVAAYRDALKLLLQFTCGAAHRSIETLRFEDLTADVVGQFLDHLETARHNTVRTRNARLAAIHSFMRYVLSREPSLAVACQRVLAIPDQKDHTPNTGLSHRGGARSFIGPNRPFDGRGRTRLSAIGSALRHWRPGSRASRSDAR